MDLSLAAFLGCKEKRCVKFLVRGQHVAAVSKSVRMANRPEQALEICLAAYELDPNNIKVLNEIAMCSLYLRRFNIARQWLHRALGVESENLVTFNVMGYSFLLENYPIQARSWFRKVLAREPENTIALNYMGKSYLLERDLNSAQEQFEKTLKLDRKNRLARECLGKIRYWRRAAG